MRIMISARPATPPTTPPAIAPVLVCEDGLVGLIVGTDVDMYVVGDAGSNVVGTGVAVTAGVVADASETVAAAKPDCS